MPSSPEADHPQEEELAGLPDGLSAMGEQAILIGLLEGGGFAMVSVFVVGVLAALLPFRPADPLWLIGIITTLLSNAGYALTGFVLVHLAAAFAPDRLDLQRRCDRISRLAVLVALGFLLLIPLQAFSVWRGVSLSRGAEARQQELTTRSIAELRQQISAAATLDQLQAHLSRIQAPPLTDADRALPLPQLKQRLFGQLAQAEAGVRQAQAASRFDLSRQLPAVVSNLRVLVLSLIFAFAFASGARRRGQPLPFLEEWLMRRQLARDQAVQRRQELREMKQHRLIEKLEQIEQERLAPSLAEPPPPPSPQRPRLRKRRGRHGTVDADYFETIFAEEDNQGEAPEEQSQDQSPPT